MGVDCMVMVGHEYHSLDRWWCFSEEFDHGEMVSIEEAREKLKYLADYEDHDNSPETRYRAFWRGFVNGLLSGVSEVKVTFYNDADGYPEEYYTSQGWTD